MLLPSERFGDGCTLSYHLISEILTLKPCVSADAKGLCRKLQLEVEALQQPIWSQSPQPLLTAKHHAVSFELGSLTELHLLGKRGGRGGIPAVVSEEWVLRQSGPQQAV